MWVPLGGLLGTRAFTSPPNRQAGPPEPARKSKLRSLRPRSRRRDWSRGGSALGSDLAECASRSCCARGPCALAPHEDEQTDVLSWCLPLDTTGRREI